MTPLLLLQFLHSLAALWHVLAFAAGGVFVYFSYRSLFGLSSYDSQWGRIIRHADVHLWLSGFAIIALGATLTAPETYFGNPKLWTKIAVITVWFIASQFFRHYALPRFRKGERDAMLLVSSVSLACWIYGAFLGCAKQLAYGAASCTLLGGGFVATTAAVLAITYYYEKKRLAAVSQYPRAP